MKHHAAKVGGRHPPCPHTGHPVNVGRYQVHAGGTWYLKPHHTEGMDVLVSLNGHWVTEESVEGQEEIDLCLPDFGGVPDDWRERLESEIIPLLADGKKLLAFCTASHGRTGTFLASLIALLETAEQTPDPIAAVRQRHCSHAVESRAQAEAIFALRGESLPEQYSREFTRRPAVAAVPKEGS